MKGLDPECIDTLLHGTTVARIHGGSRIYCVDGDIVVTELERERPSQPEERHLRRCVRRPVHERALPADRHDVDNAALVARPGCCRYVLHGSVTA